MFVECSKDLQEVIAGVAAKIREIVCGDEDQEFLFEEGNERYLVAYVEFGHRFYADNLYKFLRIADSGLVKIYIEMGYEIDDQAKLIVIERHDDELIRALVEAGTWGLFPKGCSLPEKLGVLVDDISEEDLKL